MRARGVLIIAVCLPEYFEIQAGRARNRRERLDGLIRLERCAGGYYWLDINGGELRQGETLLDAEPLQPSFVATMIAKGRGW